MDKTIISFVEKTLFNNKKIILFCFAILTVFFSYSLTNLRIDVGFNKLLPLKHEYMKTFMQYHSEFGGANRILVALMEREGDIFNKEYFEALNSVTDEMFFITGIKRTQIRSLFTPNVRFTEVVEDGISGGNVIPDNFIPDTQGLNKVKENIYKAGIIGRLVANDFSGTLISAQLQEIDPNTGKKLDYFLVANQLETEIRDKYQEQYPNLDIHIIGYAKYINDIADGAKQMVWFFLVTVLIITLLVIYYSQSVVAAIIPVICSLVAVIWQLGILPLIGFGIDPMSMLVPFLIFAIGVSHGVQMISHIKYDVYYGLSAEQASRNSLRNLLLPGIIALLSDTVGFITIMLIDVGIIREMAITASIGVAIIILTNLILLPLLASYLKLDLSYKKKIEDRVNSLCKYWKKYAGITHKTPSNIIICFSVFLLVVSVWQGNQVKIGDQHQGVPELRSDSRYNTDSFIISSKFSIGVDILNVIVETKPEGCIHYDIMNNIDKFTWHVRNLPGVKDVVSLPYVAKKINAGWNEGYLKWRELPRNEAVLTQSISYIPTSSGLLNPDCSVMSIMIFTEDHKEETIKTLIEGIKSFQKNNSNQSVTYRLATGNVGVMAASNEEVKAAQFPILIYVFCAVIILVHLAFRSFSAVFIIIAPLALVSIMAYAVMGILEIGLKVNTLPVVALGIGIGVDYGIYLYSRLMEQYNNNNHIASAYEITLATTGYSILFTGVTLSLGVLSWIFSPLKFQMDMGILLVFMFFVNMLTALTLIPALLATYLRLSGSKDKLLARFVNRYSK